MGRRPLGERKKVRVAVWMRPRAKARLEELARLNGLGCSLGTAMGGLLSRPAPCACGPGVTCLERAAALGLPLLGQGQHAVEMCEPCRDAWFKRVRDELAARDAVLADDADALERLIFGITAVTAAAVPERRERERKKPGGAAPPRRRAAAEPDADIYCGRCNETHSPGQACPFTGRPL